MADDITIRRASGRADLESCVSLQRAVWGLEDLEITSLIQFVATLHAGGLLHLAETGEGRPVGFAYAFPAVRGGTPHLHSDMLAVLPDQQDRGLGARLKWAQRDDALLAGVKMITWTYDPLQARNANLNLHRLGVVATEFLADFYGTTSSPLHHQLPTDRLFVRWDLESPRVLEKARVPAERRSPTPEGEAINEVKWQAGWPVSSDPRIDLEGPRLLLEIPPDWNTLARSGPRVAQAWQVKVRKAFEAYLGRGYVATEFASAEEGGRRRPTYVLTKA